MIEFLIIIQKFSGRININYSPESRENRVQGLKGSGCQGFVSIDFSCNTSIFLSCFLSGNG